MTCHFLFHHPNKFRYNCNLGVPNRSKTFPVKYPCRLIFHGYFAQIKLSLSPHTIEIKIPNRSSHSYRFSSGSPVTNCTHKYTHAESNLSVFRNRALSAFIMWYYCHNKTPATSNYSFWPGQTALIYGEWRSVDLEFVRVELYPTWTNSIEETGIVSTNAL